MRWLLALAILVFVFISGCTGTEEERRSPLGFKASTEECDLDPELDRDSELMNCYHTVALTHAHLNSQQAENICQLIWTRFGEGSMNQDSDVVVKAEMVSNACFYDVALIMADEDICRNIGSKRTTAVETNLAGEAVSQDRCEVEAARRAQIAPQHYWSTQDNLCSMIYILPLLLLGAFLRCP